MTLQVPSLLMLIGAALLAVAIFAPKSPRAVAVSVLAAPAAVIDRREPPLAEQVPDLLFRAPQPVSDAPPRWPERFDPRAAFSDAEARIALIDALADVRAGWSDAVLRAAFDEETDPNVRRALEAVLAQRAEGVRRPGAA